MKFKYITKVIFKGKRKPEYRGYFSEKGLFEYELDCIKNERVKTFTAFGVRSQTFITNWHGLKQELNPSI